MPATLQFWEWAFRELSTCCGPTGQIRWDAIDRFADRYELSPAERDDLLTRIRHYEAVAREVERDGDP